MIWNITNQEYHYESLDFLFCLDWAQCTDANSGHPYYWNIVTKEVTWEMPMDYQLFLEQAMQRNSYSLKKWILCHTDDSAPYYFNEITREISWEKPDDFNTNPSSNDTAQNQSVHTKSGSNDNVINLICFNLFQKGLWGQTRNWLQVKHQQMTVNSVIRWFIMMLWIKFSIWGLAHVFIQNMCWIHSWWHCSLESLMFFSSSRFANIWFSIFSKDMIIISKFHLI